MYYERVVNKKYHRLKSTGPKDCRSQWTSIQSKQTLVAEAVARHTGVYTFDPKCIFVHISTTPNKNPRHSWNQKINYLYALFYNSVHCLHSVSSSPHSPCFFYMLYLCMSTFWYISMLLSFKGKQNNKICSKVGDLECIMLCEVTQSKEEKPCLCSLKVEASQHSPFREICLLITWFKIRICWDVHSRKCRRGLSVKEVFVFRVVHEDFLFPFEILN